MMFGLTLFCAGYIIWIGRDIIMLLFKNLISALIEFRLFEFACNDKFTEDSVNECERVYPIVSEVSTPKVEEVEDSWGLLDYYVAYKIFVG